MANPNTTFVQNEQPYLYCSVCGRKEYRLNQVGVNSAGTQQFQNPGLGSSGVICMAYNSAPGKYPNQACQGILTATTSTLTALDNQTQLNERTTS